MGLQQGVWIGTKEVVVDIEDNNGEDKVHPFSSFSTSRDAEIGRRNGEQGVPGGQGGHSSDR